MFLFSACVFFPCAGIALSVLACLEPFFRVTVKEDSTTISSNALPKVAEK